MATCLAGRVLERLIMLQSGKHIIVILLLLGGERGGKIDMGFAGLNFP